MIFDSKFTAKVKMSSPTEEAQLVFSEISTIQKKFTVSEGRLETTMVLWYHAISEVRLKHNL
jgi:hypothetical protein